MSLRTRSLLLSNGPPTFVAHKFVVLSMNGIQLHVEENCFYLIIWFFVNQILPTPMCLLFYDLGNHITLCLFVLVCMYTLFQPQKTILYDVRKAILSVTCCLSILCLVFPGKTCPTELNVSDKTDDNTRHVSK